jgi:hypothetical protein
LAVSMKLARFFGSSSGMIISSQLIS